MVGNSREGFGVQRPGSPAADAAGGAGPVIVVAPDKFKGCLSASEVAAALARGLRARLPRAQLVEHPIADGGEGTVEMALAHGFERVPCVVQGPAGNLVQAAYALRRDTAVIEMSAAAGLSLLIKEKPSDLDARTASTSGVGELISSALDRGAKEIVLAVGGSASTDGGAGMVSALGGQLMSKGHPVKPEGGQSLLAVDDLDLTGLDQRLRAATVLVACDVDNPLTGPHGAAAVYAAQKGATPATVGLLEQSLSNWANVAARVTHRDMRGSPGAGAAGGLAFGAAALLGGHLRSGIDLLLQLSGFPDAVAAADLVLVGEGSLDEQSLRGKGPIGVAEVAARAGARCIAVAGRCAVEERRLQALGISRVYTLADLEPDPRRSMQRARQLLELTAGQVASDWLASDPASSARRKER